MTPDTPSTWASCQYHADTAFKCTQAVRLLHSNPSTLKTRVACYSWWRLQQQQQQPKTPPPPPPHTQEPDIKNKAPLLTATAAATAAPTFSTHVEELQVDQSYNSAALCSGRCMLHWLISFHAPDRSRHRRDSSCKPSQLFGCCFSSRTTTRRRRRRRRRGPRGNEESQCFFFFGPDRKFCFEVALNHKMAFC